MGTDLPHSTFCAVALPASHGRKEGLQAEHRGKSQLNLRRSILGGIYRDWGLVCMLGRRRRRRADGREKAGRHAPWEATRTCCFLAAIVRDVRMCDGGRWGEKGGLGEGNGVGRAGR